MREVIFKENYEFYIRDVFPENDKLAIYLIYLSMAINDLQTVYIQINEELIIKRKKYEKDRRIMYLFRLLCSHLKEAIHLLEFGENFNSDENTPKFKQLFQTLLNNINRFLCGKKFISDEKKPIIKLNLKFRELLQRIPEEIKNLLDELHQCYSPWRESNFLSDVLRPIRNNFFHYSINNKLYKKIVVEKKKEDRIKSGIKFGSIKFKDLYLKYADEISGRIIHDIINAYYENNKNLKDNDKEKNSNEKFSEIMEKILEITENLLTLIQYLLKRYIQDKMKFIEENV